jgi:presenilin 1
MSNLKCFICGKDAIVQCSACGRAKYCSVECQKEHWITHRVSCVTQSNNQDSLTQIEDDLYERLRFYIKELNTLLKPVLLCIFTSIMWVKLNNPAILFFETRVAAPNEPSFGKSFGTTGGQSDSESLLFAAIIMGQIVVSTVIMACLMHYGKVKIILGMLGVVLIMLLGYFGFQLISNLLQVSNLALDWISIVFYLWNFTVVGIMVIFFDGPLLLRKAYLVLVSSMMAFSLSQLPELVTWVLLVFLAIWGKELF